MAGDRALLPLPAGGLRSVVGEEVEGSALQVVGVTKQGFLAGAGELTRLYVLWPGEPPVVGTQVDLRGTVRPPRELGLSAADARAVDRAGGWIRATAVERAG